MSHEVLGSLSTIINQTVERVNPNTSFYRWKINGFSRFSREVLSCIVSPPFMAIDSKVTWYLKLYPNSRITRGESDCMQLGIYYYSSIAIKASVELSIVNIDNEIVKAYKLKKELQLKIADRKTKFQTYVDAGCSRFMVKRSDVGAPENRLLADDCLTISFDVTFPDPIVKLPISSENNKENSKNDKPQKFDDFGLLLENGKFSDVKFVVGNKEIHAHKAILASRSPVFDAMFQHEMQENEKNIVVIVDIEYAVMKEFFRFIYTNTVANIELMASDLLVAADKYCVERLKALCEKSLLNSLNINNALRCLIRAEQCNSADLKKQILEFVVKHSTRVVENDEFALLPPYLMCEITRAMARKGNAIQGYQYPLQYWNPSFR